MILQINMSNNRYIFGSVYCNLFYSSNNSGGKSNVLCCLPKNLPKTSSFNMDNHISLHIPVNITIIYII